MSPARIAHGKLADGSEFGLDFKRVTNSNVKDDLAPLIIITPGDEGFFEGTN